MLVDCPNAPTELPEAESASVDISLIRNCIGSQVKEFGGRQEGANVLIMLWIQRRSPRERQHGDLSLLWPGAIRVSPLGLSKSAESFAVCGC